MSKVNGDQKVKDFLNDMPAVSSPVVEQKTFVSSSYHNGNDADLELPDPSKRRKGSGASDSTDSILNELSQQLGFQSKLSPKQPAPTDAEGIQILLLLMIGNIFTVRALNFVQGLK